MALRSKICSRFTLFKNSNSLGLWDVENTGYPVLARGRNIPTALGGIMDKHYSRPGPTPILGYYDAHRISVQIREFLLDDHMVAVDITHRGISEAVDLYIKAELKSVAENLPQHPVHIISNDKGYLPLMKQLKEAGCPVSASVTNLESAEAYSEAVDFVCHFPGFIFSDPSSDFVQQKLKYEEARAKFIEPEYQEFLACAILQRIHTVLQVNKGLKSLDGVSARELHRLYLETFGYTLDLSAFDFPYEQKNPKLKQLIDKYGAQNGVKLVDGHDRDKATLYLVV